MAEPRMASVWDRRYGIDGSEFTRGPFKILTDGNPHNIPWMDTLSGIGHPLFLPYFRHSNLRATLWGPGPASLLRVTVGWIVPSNPESRLGNGGGLGSEAAVSLGTKAPKSQTSINAEILTSRRRCRTRVRGTWRGCGGGFAEQVTGNVEKGEAPTLLR
jgi:hypothetical protein